MSMANRSKGVIKMLFFMDERYHFLMANESSDTLKEFWNNYHTFRYDFCFSFGRFLRENGIDARAGFPDLSPYGYSITDIEISLN